jgi:hypothetical protein
MFKHFILALFFTLLFCQQGFNDINKVESWNIEQTTSSNANDIEDSSADPSAINTFFIVVVLAASEYYQTILLSPLVKLKSLALIRAPPPFIDLFNTNPY